MDNSAVKIQFTFFGLYKNCVLTVLNQNCANQRKYDPMRISLISTQHIMSITAFLNHNDT